MNKEKNTWDPIKKGGLARDIPGDKQQQSQLSAADQVNKSSKNAKFNQELEIGPSIQEEASDLVRE